MSCNATRCDVIKFNVTRCNCKRACYAMWKATSLISFLRSCIQDNMNKRMHHAQSTTPHSAANRAQTSENNARRETMPSHCVVSETQCVIRIPFTAKTRNRWESCPEQTQSWTSDPRRHFTSNSEAIARLQSPRPMAGQDFIHRRQILHHHCASNVFGSTAS